MKVRKLCLFGLNYLFDLIWHDYLTSERNPWFTLKYFLSFPVCFWCENSAEKNSGHWGINCLYKQRRSPLQMGPNLIPRGGGDQGIYWALSEALQLGSEMATLKKEVCGIIFFLSNYYSGSPSFHYFQTEFIFLSKNLICVQNNDILSCHLSVDGWTGLSWIWTVRV